MAVGAELMLCCSGVEVLDRCPAVSEKPGLIDCLHVSSALTGDISWTLRLVDFMAAIDELELMDGEVVLAVEDTTGLIGAPVGPATKLPVLINFSGAILY